MTGEASQRIVDSHAGIAGLVRTKDSEMERIINDDIYMFWSLKEIQKSHSLVRPLPHFYGEMAKTSNGCAYIMDNGEFSDDVKRFIFNVHSAYTQMNELKSGKDSSLNNNNLELRSCLWALGMIGSSEDKEI